MIGGLPQIAFEVGTMFVNFSENCGLSPLLDSVRLFNGLTGVAVPLVTSTRIPLRTAGSPHRLAVGRLTGSLLTMVSVPLPASRADPQSAGCARGPPWHSSGRPWIARHQRRRRPASARTLAGEAVVTPREGSSAAAMGRER